jgi:putative ABC transport system ATP-binding protein
MLLQLKNVSKIYKMDGLQVKALDNVSLSIQKGDFLAIQGPSGSGKSTLMHLMGCLDTPTKGEVIFDGEDISELNEAELAKIRNQKVGFVFQTFNLLPRTSALANVELPLIYTSLNNRTQERTRATKILKMVGLKKRTDHFPSQLSGGEQQRVAIARALVNKPAIIFADEPTGNLDSKSGKEIMAIFQRLNQAGNTIVIVTHDSQIAHYAKKIIRIKDGRIQK